VSEMMETDRQTVMLKVRFVGWLTLFGTSQLIACMHAVRGDTTGCIRDTLGFVVYAIPSHDL